jgi:hypothetical protein
MDILTARQSGALVFVSAGRLDGSTASDALEQVLERLSTPA